MSLAKSKANFRISKSDRELSEFDANNHIPTEALGKWQALLPEMYDFSSGDVPPHLGANHFLPNAYGPLKADPNKPCPAFDQTKSEAEEKCYSAQEVAWGTKTLGRLEKIKSAVDPNGIFTCFRCVKPPSSIESNTSIDESSSTVVTLLAMTKTKMQKNRCRPQLPTAASNRPWRLLLS